MRIKIFLVFFLLTGVFSSVARAQDASSPDNAPGGVVSEVVISGNKRTEASLIELNVETKKGDSYSADRVKEDLKKIYALGFFQQVYVDVEKTPAGVRVEFIVEENPVLADLKLSGNDKLSDGDIKDAIQLREGRIISLRKIRESRNLILDLASQKGLIGTEVEYEIEPRAEGVVDVVYDIREGEKKYIKEVRIIGADMLEEEEIKKSLYSKPKYFFSFLTKRGLFKVEEIRRDSDRIKAFYIDKGYLDVNVSEPEFRYDEVKDGYVVSFSVEEGNSYSVSKITFSGVLAKDEDKILPKLELAAGSTFSSFTLRSDINRVTDFYGDKGYAFANVTPDVRLDRKNRLVTIDYSVEKGNMVSVRNINISDNTRTRDRVIRRELSLQEQEPFNVSKLRAVRYQVQRLGYFEDNVEVITQRVEGTDDLIDVNIKVEERPTGFFSIGGGVSSIEKFLFAGQIQESNFLGYGKTISLDAQIGGVTEIFSLTYRDPYLFGSKWLLDIFVFSNKREYRDFDRVDRGFSLSFGKRVLRLLQARASLEVKRQNVRDVAADARLIITETTRTVVSTGFSLSWDQRNNYLDPTRGILVSTGVEHAGFLGGNTEFFKYVSTVRFWVPFLKNTYFAAKANYAYLNLINEGDDLVVEERFFLGGPHTLRGYDYRSVGPRRDLPDDDGYVVIGGTRQVLGSVDFVFPLSVEAKLKAVAFFDIGNAFDEGEVSLNPSNLRKDVGFGLRWISPLGPIKLDFGFPVGKKLPGDDTYEVQFTIGNIL